MNQEKVAIVTGGGTGIGRAVSIALAKRGVAVAILYSRSQSEALETVSTIEALGRRAIALHCNITVEEEVRRAVQCVQESFKAIDYVVNNAGATCQLPFFDLDAIDESAWDELYAINVKGAFFVARAAAPFMKDRDSAAIVNVGSIAGVTGYGSSLPYAVSKAAMHGLTRSLARALAPQIRVNCVAPGMVATRWWAGNSEKMHQLAGHVALERVATPDDIADVVIDLLLARSMTGQVLLADNGQTL
jgi:3-oxoacyl-[acyl-carrier protein] reductase